MFKEKLLVWDKLPEGRKSGSVSAAPKGSPQASSESVPTVLKKCKMGRNKECENLALHLTAGDLFAPAKEFLDVRREDIPRDLPVLLSGVSEIEFVPASYDSKKPNLYLIGDAHVGKKARYDKLAYAVQEEALRTFHVLYGLGVRSQALESVPPGTELKHNVKNRLLGQHTPADKIMSYKKSGKIGKACAAIEGIYEDKVFSQGVDDSHPALRMEEEVKIAKRGFFTVLFNVITGLCDYLHIPYDRASLQGSSVISYLYTLRDSVRGAVVNLTATQIEELVNNHVLANSEYKRILDIASQSFYEDTQGRNKKIAATINGNTRDTAFIIGAAHIEDLKSQIRGYNVFVIRPKSLYKRPFKPLFSNYTLADYRRAILEDDLYREFGLRLEEPQGDPLGARLFSE